jgi:hypothetical protein
MESRDFTCQSGRRAGLSAPDVDATAYAVMALRTAKRAGVSGLGDEIRDALAWLVRAQGADGSLGGADTSSATSTGLAARVLNGTRFDDAASAAAQWVSTLQITPENSAGTARSSDVGAVADDTQKFTDAANGISESARTSWYISTAQGGPGLNALVAP